jgi:predicted NBD/HSP70 family sugar kinase
MAKAIKVSEGVSLRTTNAVDYHALALKLIREAGQCTRSQLAEWLEISLSLVNRLVNDLLSAGLILEMGQLESNGGRPAVLLVLNPDGGYVIGVDYGEKSQSAALVNLAGKRIATITEQAVPTEERQKVVEAILDLVERVTMKGAIPRERILGLGVGIRDIVDASMGMVYGTPQPGWGSVWVEFPLLEALNKQSSIAHIVVDDIVRALATAETAHLPANEKDFLFILADQGLGMAIMIDGKPFTGFSHIAGEIGHIPVESGPLCTCGSYGCLSLHADTLSIVAKVRERLDTLPMKSMLSQVENPSIEQVIEAANGGDKLAYQVMTEAGQYLGKALSVVVNLLGPRTIVIGGRLSRAERYVQAAYETIKMTALDRASRFVQVIPSELDETAGPVGAASLALNALFQPGAGNLLRLIQQGQV